MRLFIFILSSLFFSQSIAGENSIEYKIKAGYLYNFTKFITWPENKLETFNLCILGKDPFGTILNPIEKRLVKGKPIRLIRIQKISEARLCHIIYTAEPSQAGILISGALTIDSFPLKLTVGESKQFTYQGGMISFFKREGKIRLHINLQRLRESGLEVSAKLLEVADVYVGGEHD